MERDIEFEVVDGNDLMAGISQGLRPRTRLFNLKPMPNRFLPDCEEHLGRSQAGRADDGDTYR